MAAERTYTREARPVSATSAKLVGVLVTLAALLTVIFMDAAGEWLVPAVLATLLSLDLYRTFVRK